MRRRGRERESSSDSSGYLFPIGLGLGALVAIALFFGLSVGPFDAPRNTSGTTVASGKLPGVRSENAAPGGTDDASPALPAGTVATAPAAATPVPPSESDDAGRARPTGLEALANPAGEHVGTTAGASGLPSVDDPESVDLFGGRVAMVSSAVPRVVVLADGTSLVPGERLPGGHRIIGIERERILLERDGAEWQVRVP